MAAIKLKGDTSGEITIQAPAVAGTTTLNLPATSSTLATQNALGVRNLIINGDMRIAQRGTSSTGITTTGYYTVDRFRVNVQALGTWTQTQETDVPSGQGFSNSIKMTCTTADASPASTDFVGFRQLIEGQNLQHLRFGTSNAESITLSFWVKSNKTGTGTITIRQPDASNRQVSPSYTISSADTWEKKTITIAGDTSGQINNDNGEGLTVEWFFNSGIDFTSGTNQTSWTAFANADRNVSNLGVGGTVSDYFQLTGVQLEVGDTATPFEHRPYDMELARCQRYCWVWDASQASSNFAKVALGWFNNATTFRCLIHFPTTMRASPSSITSTGAFNVFDGTSNITVSAVGIDQAYTQTLSLTVTTSAATQFRPGFYQAEANQTAKLEVSAEL